MRFGHFSNESTSLRECFWVSRCERALVIESGGSLLSSHAVQDVITEKLIASPAHSMMTA